MPEQSRLVVKKLTPTIGAEISGADLTQPLELAVVREIEKILFDNQVVFFRNQPMTLEQQIRFGKYFGDLYIHPAAGKTTTAIGEAKPKPYASAVEDHPEVIKIYADEKSVQAAGEEWHSDVMSEDKPPMGSILRIDELPSVGGDTLFASMYAAYEALSEPMKRFLEPFTAVQDGMKTYGVKSAFDNSRQYPRSEHPIVRTHPVTGRQSLFLSSAFTTRIVQLSPSESDALLKFLFDHVKNSLFQCRFRWEKDSVAFWDNRCTLHQAQWDYFPHRRVGYRVQIIGDKPFHRSGQ
jgi:taurine dioxygenase